MYEAIVPFVKENGLSWVLPLHETVETFLAGVIFAVASSSGRARFALRVRSVSRLQYSLRVLLRVPYFIDSPPKMFLL